MIPNLDSITSDYEIKIGRVEKPYEDEQGGRCGPGE